MRTSIGAYSVTTLYCVMMIIFVSTVAICTRQAVRYSSIFPGIKRRVIGFHSLSCVGYQLSFMIITNVACFKTIQKSLTFTDAV